MTSKEAWASVMYQKGSERILGRKGTHTSQRDLCLDASSDKCSIGYTLSRVKEKSVGHVLKRARIFSDVKMLRNKLESRAEIVSCMLLILRLVVVKRVVSWEKR
jgi:hypothetical protein